MPLFNSVKLYGDDVAKALEPGERLLAMGTYHELLNGDDSKLELEDHELSPFHQRYLAEHGHRLPTSDKFFQGFTWYGLDVNSDRINRALSGLCGIGAPDSIAGRMWRAGKSASKGSSGVEWAVTDRRLLLLESDIAVDKTYKILFSVPRSSIASVRRKGKLLFQWGRVEVSFTDGSMLSWNAALLDVWAARALVASLSGPGQTGAAQ